MKNLLLTGLFFISAFSFAQDIKATTEDGKKVILKSNKTWSYDESKVESKNSCVISSDTHFHIGLLGCSSVFFVSTVNVGSACVSSLSCDEDVSLQSLVNFSINGSTIDQFSSLISVAIVL